MQISNDSVYNAVRAYLNQQVKEPRNDKCRVDTGRAKQLCGPTADTMELSDRAKDIGFALKVVRGTPEIRENLVNALKEKIEAGAYTVSGEKIAEKIIARAVVDELV